MKLRFTVVLLTILVSVCVMPVSAQEASDDGRKVKELRAELNNAQDRVAELKIRLEELNFDLKPENIERHFNGFGSTHPEELREARRRELQTEKNRVVAQVEQLTSITIRMEAAINSVQARAYQQSVTTVVMKTGRNPDRYFLFLTRVMIPIAVCTRSRDQ